VKKKLYVTVDCRMSRSGAEKPLRIYWSDGKSWTVDKVLHTNRSYEEGLEGIRYTILIGSAEKYIYRDDAGWYVVPNHTDGGDHECISTYQT